MFTAVAIRRQLAEHYSALLLYQIINNLSSVSDNYLKIIVQQKITINKLNNYLKIIFIHKAFHKYDLLYGSIYSVKWTCFII